MDPEKTEILEQPPAARPQPRPGWRPVEAGALPELAAVQARWTNRLLGLLPMAGGQASPAAAVCARLEATTGLEHHLRLHRVRCLSGGEGFSPRVDSGFVNRFHVASDPEVGLLAVDAPIVDRWLAGVLGEEPHRDRRLFELTPRDYGLVTFLTVDILDALGQRGLPPLLVASSRPDPDKLVEQVGRHRWVVEAVWALEAGQTTGCVRIYMPATMVANLELFAAEQTRQAWRRGRLREESRLGGVELTLAVDVAAIRLGRLDWASLAAGDLLVPQTHGLHAQGHGGQSLAGAASGRLWLDAAYRRFLACHLERDGASIHAIIDQVTPQEITMSSDPQQDAAPSPEPGAESTALLEMADVEVGVRVGQVRLSVAELAQLAPGFVLELDGRLEDGVDLVVEGRRVGRGELVEVEGRLGVRVTRLDGRRR